MRALLELVRRSAGTSLGALLGLVTLTAAASAAQITAPALGPPQSQGFNLGMVRLPQLSLDNPNQNWTLAENGVFLKSIESYSTDPTFEVVVAAPKSGHPTLNECFLLQIPNGVFADPVSERTLVVAFHPFSQSELSPFSGSTLPEECDARRWILVSPLGLNQANFASVPTQESLDRTLALVGKYVPYNRSRVYTVGFSMGGCNALSYAMRHQDPNGLRVAGVVCHTGTQDVDDSVVGFDQTVQDFIAKLFSGLVSETPFEYERVSPALMAGLNSVIGTEAPVSNLTDVPIYFHVNTGDPNVDLVQNTLAVRQFLTSKGFNTALDIVDAGFTHQWGTMDMKTALDFIDGATAPGPLPVSANVLELFADLETRYRFTEVLELDPQTRGRMRLVLPTGGNNSLGVQQLFGIRRLAVETAGLELDFSQNVLVSTWSVDGGDFDLELRGVVQAPSSVLVNGLPTTVDHDPATATLRIDSAAGGAFALVEILP